MKNYEELEELAQLELSNSIIRKAIGDTYKGKSPTKKRRTLPGKRVWKNKARQYAILEGTMTAKEFNARQKALKALKNIEKEQVRQRKKHSIM